LRSRSSKITFFNNQLKNGPFGEIFVCALLQGDAYFENPKENLGAYSEEQGEKFHLDVK